MRNVPALRHFLLAFGIPALFCSVSPAQIAANADSGDSGSGVANYLTRTVKLSGSVRERWEATDGDFSSTPADSYLLSQIRFGMDFHPTSWLSFFGEAQDARALFYQAAPSSSLQDPFDLHQAWVAVGRHEGNGGFAEIGRQELTIGSGRLINSTETWWTNSARTFDVVHGAWTSDLVKAEIVAGSVVQADTARMDRHKSGDHVYAEYNTFGHLLPGATIEPYFFARTFVGVKSKDGKVGDMDTLAAGGRIAGKLPTAIDYSFEALHEMGSYSDDRLAANGLAALVGWKITTSGWAPRISSDLAYASGDDGQKNGSRETFDNMYGSNQPLNSLTGLFGWRNIKDWRSGVDFRPVKKLAVKIDYRDYWLASTHDGMYNASGSIIVAANAKATSAHIGESVETMSTLSVTKTTAIGFGVGNMFPGEYLREAHKTNGFIYPYISLYQKF